jgi:MscS family membrane protein
MMGLVLESGTGFAFPSQVNYLANDAGVDATKKKEAEAAVAAWREESRLPFPEFAADEVRHLDGRLDYPPKGSPTSLTDRTEDHQT